MNNLYYIIILTLLSGCIKKSNDIFGECDNDHIEFLTVIDTVNNYQIDIPTHFELRDSFKYLKFVAYERVDDSVSTILSIENYELNGEDLNQFYINKRATTIKQLLVESEAQLSNDYDLKINDRPAKLSVISIEKSGIELTTSQFYISDGEHVLIATIATTSNHQEKRCLLKRSLESVKRNKTSIN